jgi:multiple sugar transport system permease protein
VVAVAEPTPRRWRNVFEQQQFLAAILIGPAVIFIVALVGGPLLLAIQLSVTDTTTGNLSGDFVGLRNFVDAWDDPNFRRALRNTILFTVVSQVIVVVCAGLIAHALVRPIRFKWILRLLIILPWAAPVPLTTIAWLWIFDSLFSVVNWVAKRLQLVDQFNPPQWLGDPNLALAAVTTVHAWRIIPFAVVIFLAGLASLPEGVEDAAKVDGAVGLKKFWYVTLPLQLPIATVAVLFGIVFTATDLSVVYILTQGGPFNSTHMLTTWAFQKGIVSGSLSEGAAISLYLLPVLLVVAVLMLRFARKVEVT